MPLSDRPNGPQILAAASTAQTALNLSAALAAPLPAVQLLTATTATVILNPQNTALALICPLSPNEGNEGTCFDLWASGMITTTNTTNITGKLESGTNIADASNTNLGSSSAIACNTISCNWRVHAELLYDSTSGKLTGTFEWLINNTLTAKAVLATVVTGLKDTNSPVANFVLSFTSSAATVPLPTTITVKKFSVG
jgi:hypothetical protein